MRKRRRSLLLFLIVLCALIIAARIYLNRLAGNALQQLFAEGTGCTVALSSPYVALFPLRARVRDVFFQHPDEEPGEGLRVGEIAVRIRYSDLLNKQVVLRNLQLKETRIVSKRKRSSFMALMDFILKENPKPAAPPPEEWHSFISSGWKVKMKSLELYPKSASDLSFIFSTGSTELQIQGLHLLLDRDNPLRGAYGMHASMIAFSVQPPNGRALNFGRVKILGEIGNGRFTASQLTMSVPGGAESFNTLKAHGIYEFDSEILDFDAIGDLGPEYLKGLLPPAAHPFLAAQDPQLSITIRAAGVLDDPKLWGNAALKLINPLSVPGAQHCGASDITGKFALDTTILTAEGIEVDDVLSDGTFALLFNEQQTFRSKGNLALDAESGKLAKCLSDLEAVLGRSNEKAAARMSRVHATIRHAIADAHAAFDVKGYLDPIAVEAELLSDLAVKTSSERSTLKAHLSYLDSIISFAVEEQGRYDQVQYEQVLAAAEEKTQTAFVAAPNSILSAEGEIELTTGKADVSHFVIERYPFRRLLARAAPFLSNDQFSPLWKMTADDSLLSADMALKIGRSPEDLQGKGEIAVEGLDAYGVELEHVSATVRFRGADTEIRDVLMITKGGALRGEIALYQDTTIGGFIAGEGLVLENIGLIESIAPGLQGKGRLKLEMTGTQTKPDIDADLFLETTLKGYSFNAVQTTIGLHTDEESLNLEAVFLGGLGNASAKIPFRGKRVPAVVHAEMRDFPLRVFFVSEMDTGNLDSLQSGENGAKYGLVSAALDYEGYTDDFFKGSGTLRINEMTLFDGAPLVVQSRPLVAAIKDNKLEFANVELFPDEEPLTLTGYLDKTGWAAELSGNCNIAQLLPFFPALEHAEGEIEASLGFAGPLASPDISGTLAFHSGALSIPLGTSVVGLREIEMAARFEDGGLFVDTFNGKVGAGELLGTLQATELFDPDRLSITMVAGFNDVYLEPMDQLSIVAEGETRLTFQPEAEAKLTGDIRLLSMLYENNLSLKRVMGALSDYIAGTGASSGASSSSRAKEESNPLVLDLHVSAENNLIVDTSFAQAELRGELWVRGSPSIPLLEGKVSVIDGGYGFRSTNFDIVKGDVVFSDKTQQTDPKLDFLSEAMVSARSSGEYRVQMFIRGTLSDPDVSFASDGGLSQNQVVQLLGVGANLEALSLSAGGGSDSSLFDLLNPASQVALDDRIRGLAGFSDISIAPSVSASTGEIVPKVVAVRPLVRDVDLQLETQLSVDPESEAAVKYPLTPYLRLLAGWRNRAVTEDVDAASGAWLAGIGFRKTFPGVSLIPFTEE